MRTISMEELMSSKVYVSDSQSVIFHNPEFYLQRFIRAAVSLNCGWRIGVSNEIIIAEEEGREETIAYPRVLAEAQFNEPEDLIGFTPVVGILYALDIQKPIIKLYSGYNVNACTNLTMVDAEKIIQKDLLSDISIIYDQAEIFLEEKHTELEDFKNNVEILKRSTLNPDAFDMLTGALIRYGLTGRFGTSIVLSAVKSMSNPNSKYYIANETTTKWNYFNALTAQITNGKDIVDRATKTVEIAKVMFG